MVEHCERTVESSSLGRWDTTQSEAPYLRPSLAMRPIAWRVGAKPTDDLAQIEVRQVRLRVRREGGARRFLAVVEKLHPHRRRDRLAEGDRLAVGDRGKEGDGAR